MQLCVSLMYGDVCLRVLCRFAFWKSLFSNALFSALLSHSSVEVYRPSALSSTTQPSRGSLQRLEVFKWPPQLQLLTRGLSPHFKHHVRPWLGSAVTARSRDLPATMREQSREERNAEVRVFLKANLLSTRRHTSPPYGNDINDTHNSSPPPVSSEYREESLRD
jgi:hypothetical protein